VEIISNTVTNYYASRAWSEH